VTDNCFKYLDNVCDEYMVNIWQYNGKDILSHYYQTISKLI
jgi:hypothetical protein